MKPDKKITQQPKSSNQSLIDSYDYLSNSASVQDCTGLIPSAPVSEYEQESYESVYHYQPPKIHPKRKAD